MMCKHLFWGGLCALALAQAEAAAPMVLTVNPAPGRVTEFKAITVTFSEPVRGVTAGDLLINNAPAATVTGSGASYIFSFPQPDFGIVDITWSEGHFIESMAVPSQAFDGEGTSARWSYELFDGEPPAASINPRPGSTVRQLEQIEVRFSEPVMGVQAGDLIIDGSRATNMITRAGVYVFQFPRQLDRTAEVKWADGHNIADLAGNLFAGAAWTYAIDPNLGTPLVVISEFLTAQENSVGLLDEDGEAQDWIELYNAGEVPVNLAGWSLTDDPDELDLWVFPEVTIPAGGRLVVFASGKDRRTNPARLHTNFKLGSDGEYLALLNAESPRLAMTEFDDYPEQRNDYSYGTDANWAWRYYQRPTPGAPNGSSAIVGVLPEAQLNLPRGTYESPFNLVVQHSYPQAVIRYTLDGSVPTSNNGQIYTGEIRIEKTTTFRAAAFADDYLPSRTITHTYIFLEGVIRQPTTPPGFPAGSTIMSGYPSDYEMDPEIVNAPAYRDLIKPALQALPVLSIVMKTEDLFGASNGIYTHPLSRGPAWERPCSVEFIPRDGQGFQVNAGIQIQGNAAREPVKQPKHPFRLVFKGDYGPRQLEYRMFPDSPVEEFDTLILRADFNVSWLHWNPTQRIRGQRTRDAWMKDSMRAMGGLATHNRYVHLYLNGLYWGIYDPSERPDGAFGAAYLGGEKEDYDIVNEGAVVDGTKAAYDRMLALSNLGTASQYREMLTYLDMTQFIDYMLLHFYGGHEDWGNNKNWYTLRPKDGSSGFKYLPWDGELILGNTSNNRVNNADVPSGLHTKLMASPEYRLAFADRVQKHLFGDGALTPAATAERWMNRARQVELAIVAESARWGDYRRDAHQYQSGPYELYTRDQQWKAEQQRLMNSYFPTRTTTVLNQLRNADLFPPLGAPSLNPPQGRITPGFRVAITAPSGTIYYTTNGTDPRVAFTGVASAEARVYSTPVTLVSDTLIKARVRSAGVWSALVEGNYTVNPFLPPVRISEIMYHPAQPGEAHEFIELRNFGGAPADIGSFYLTGVDYIFPPRTVLAPGEIILLASAANPAAVAAEYPNANVFGYFGGQLVNRGERLALLDPTGRTIVSVNYHDAKGWPELADGGGRSLEIIDGLGDPDDPANWRASALPGGTPGTQNSAVAGGPVAFTEIQAAGPETDFVRLSNFGSQSVDLSNWEFTEAESDSAYVFPANTHLAAGESITIPCDATRAGAAPFALDKDGETLLLTAGGMPMAIFTFGPQVPGRSLVLTNGVWALHPVGLGSPRALNINEWMANPLPGEDDWIELHNPGTQPVALRGLFLGTSNQIFEITSHSFVPEKGYVRLWADEEAGPNHLDFKLPASGERISLFMPTGEGIDQILYSVLAEGASFGRYPDGSEAILQFPVASPGRANALEFPVEVSVANGQITVNWPSQPGRRYRVEAVESLSRPIWSLVEEITASGASTALNHQPVGAERYFRVLALP